ncbi:MAG TPA: TetR/AcrR family transcriptional regulator [Candidatus Binatia bacterium]|nr:TetR/AcrR family transcriptional regulator [Candidatus Binatia bacterium]
MARAKSHPSPPRLSSVASRATRILDAIEEIFLTEGFRRVTVGELAARLHCSRRTLYELAGSKEDLFLMVLDRFLERIRRQGEVAAAAARDPAARIEAYLAPGIREVGRTRNTLFSDIAAFLPAKRMLDDHQRRRMKGVREIVVEGARRGIFRGLDPYLVAEVFTHAYRRVSQPDFLAAANLSLTEAYAELSRLLRHGLLHAESEPVRPERRTTGGARDSANSPRAG